MLFSILARFSLLLGLWAKKMTNKDPDSFIRQKNPLLPLLIFCFISNFLKNVPKTQLIITFVYD